MKIALMSLGTKQNQTEHVSLGALAVSSCGRRRGSLWGHQSFLGVTLTFSYFTPNIAGNPCVRAEQC